MNDSSARKVKKVKGRTNKDASDEFVGEEENNTIIFERKKDIDEEEENIVRKQKKIGQGLGMTEANIKQRREVMEKAEEGENGDLEFEDDYDDEWEEEEVINDERIEEEDDEEEEEESKFEDDSVQDDLTEQFADLKFSDQPVINLDDQARFSKKAKEREEETVPYLGTAKNLKEGEFLDFDNQAYDLFHRARTPWPCLSLDILIPRHKKDTLTVPNKVELKQYPLSVYVIAGSQASEKSENAVYIMKWSHLHKTRYDDDSAILDEEDLNNDEEPRLDFLSLNHPDPINRVRSMNGTGVVALWDESGKVCIYDTSRHIQRLVEYNQDEEEIVDDEGPNPTPQGLQPPQDPNKKNFMVGEFQHSKEGYALQWSPLSLGLLATGGCDRRLYLYKPADETCSGWSMESYPYMVHNGSVEDIEFSPSDPNLIASCSVDGTVKFIDLRSAYKNECTSHIDVTKVDVNVLSWCSKSPNLVATGSDDGSVKVWDIRYLQKARPVTDIQFHTAPITSIQFEPFEDSVLTVSSADNRITIWDFSVESDKKMKNTNDVPDQLMFIHQGLEDVKEVKHHPYMSDLILCTAANGFNIFKPNYEEEWDEDN